MLLAVLITCIALLTVNIVSAKDYSVTTGNWKIDFKSNDTLYTEVKWNEPADSSSSGNYMVWVKEDPGIISTRSGSITPLEYNTPAPFGKESLKRWMSLFFSPFNKTPILLDYTIDGKDALIAEGWNETFGRTVYGAMYPIDLNYYGTAQKSVGFLSLLDKKTNFEILDSLHVEYLGTQAISSAMNSQSSQMTPTYTELPVGTREKPVPIGTTVDLGDSWQVTVMNVIPDATNAVIRENQFNDPPKAGNQFFLARIQAKYTGSGSDTFGGSYRLRAVGPSSVGYSTFENSAGVIPDPLPDSELFSGGVVEGNIGWEIKSSDASSLVMYDNPISFGDSNDRMYMALYGSGSSTYSSSNSNDKNWGAVGAGKMGRPATWQYK
jgi:hypothetical protein